MDRRFTAGLAIVSAVGLALVATAIVANAQEPTCKWDDDCKCEVNFNSRKGTANVPAGWSVVPDGAADEDNGCCDKTGTDCDDDHNCDWSGGIYVTANGSTTWTMHYGGLEVDFTGSKPLRATLNAACDGDSEDYSFSTPGNPDKFWHLTSSCKDCAAIPD